MLENGSNISGWAEVGQKEMPSKYAGTDLPRANLRVVLPWAEGGWMPDLAMCRVPELLTP